MKTQAIVIVALAALLSFSFSATANTVEVGLSGQCYNEDASNGGGGSISVGDESVDSTDPDEVVSIATALAQFGTGTAEDRDTGSACDRYDCFSASECDGRPERSDYLEVHADAAGNRAQVCYEGSVSTGGNCDTVPSGPGSE